MTKDREDRSARIHTIIRYEDKLAREKLAEQTLKPRSKEKPIKDGSTDQKKYN